MSTLPPFAQTNLQTADWRTFQTPSTRGSDQNISDQIVWLRHQVQRLEHNPIAQERYGLIKSQLVELEALRDASDDTSLLTTIHALSATHDDAMLADLLLSLTPIERGGAAYQYATYLRETHGIIRTPTFLKKQWNALLER